MDKLAILCVDDEDIILQSLKNELHAFTEHYLIELASDGDEALEAIEDLEQDGYTLALVISDYVMPRMKGDELLTQIHQRYPDALKIMLTGQSSLTGITKAINYAGLYRYIAKPWEKEDLVLTIQEALTKYAQSQQLAQQNILLEGQNVLLRELNNELEEKVQLRTAEILEQSNQILSQKEELSKAYESLKKLGEFKEVITGSIVHDLKNPLNSIISLSDDPSVKQAGMQMLNLVMSILDVQKFEDASFQVVKSEVDMQQIIGAAYEQVSLMAKTKNHEILNKIPQGIFVEADFDIIVRVFINLLTNAIKYTANNGEITIGIDTTVELADGYICCYVEDTGVGIPEDQLSFVFDRFAQVKAKRLGWAHSTGIGLNFCKLAVMAHSGKIWAESVLKQGTRFLFTLPSNSVHIQANHEVQVLATNRSTSLLPEEQAVIQPFVADFKRLEIFDTSSIQHLLEQIDFSQSVGLGLWYEQMMDALFSVNEEKFNELLEQISS